MLSTFGLVEQVRFISTLPRKRFDTKAQRRKENKKQKGMGRLLGIGRCAHCTAACCLPNPPYHLYLPSPFSFFVPLCLCGVIYFGEDAYFRASRTMLFKSLAICPHVPRFLQRRIVNPGGVFMVVITSSSSSSGSST